MIPKLSSIHVTIDENTISRALGTGHPRLLANLLKGCVEGGLFSDVEIDRLSVGGNLRVAKQPPQPTRPEICQCCFGVLEAQHTCVGALDATRDLGRG